MKNILFLLSLLLGSSLVFGQNIKNLHNWSKNKYEIFFALGSTHFLGDLGGRDQIGTQKSIADLDFPSTKMGGAAGFRYRFHPRWATSTQLYFGILSGDDALTEEKARNERNLSFRSQIVELSQRIEYMVFADEKGGIKNKSNVVYLFTGISGFFFNPQTELYGNWTNLHPLRTEGQGLPGGADEYKRVSLAIPLGIGFKVAINEFWRLGMEFSLNKTFTDYIDDVSTVYYDPAILTKEVGPDAAAAANPSIASPNTYSKGMQRGNPDDNDAYIFANITVTRNVTYPNHRRRFRARF